ncbi:MAG TPA: SpvB/TcaC N-terminal domain-containing protein, partial [Polyangiaceae bacterium]
MNQVIRLGFVTCLLAFAGIRCEHSLPTDEAKEDVTSATQPVLVATPSATAVGNGAKVATAGAMTCAIVGNNSALKCWGWTYTGNYDDVVMRGGKLGDMGDALPLVDLGGNEVPRINEVAVGSRGTICVTRADPLNNYIAQCWGDNGFGQLGVGDTVPRGFPVLPSVPLPGYRVGVGEGHVCRMPGNKTSGTYGTVYCLGDNTFGQLGSGHSQNLGDQLSEVGPSERPVDLGAERYAKSIALGRNHTCALLDNDQVKCWGSNEYGQLGVGDTRMRGRLATDMGDNLPTVPLGTGRYAKAISAGWYFSCALLDNDITKCWGQGTSLGTGQTANFGDNPSELGDNPTWSGVLVERAKLLASGSDHSCVSNGAQITCWGMNGAGQLGLRDTRSRGNTPGDFITQNVLDYTVDQTDLGTFYGHWASIEGIAAGYQATCAVISGGSVYRQLKCWGKNASGELGLGDTNNRGDNDNEMGNHLPKVDLGSRSVAWLEDPSRPFQESPIAAGGWHTCAILNSAPNQSAGPVKCWGRNGGILGLLDTQNHGDRNGTMGDDLKFVDLGPGRLAKQLTAGYAHTCAILDDDSVKCWGINSNGQLGLGDTLTRGYMVLGSNLPVVDLGTGRKARKIRAGGNGTCALLDNGAVKCWGDNSTGLVGRGNTLDAGVESGQMGDALPAIDFGTTAPILDLKRSYSHACAIFGLTSGYGIKCWGANGAGQLGLGDTNNRGTGLNQMGTNLPFLSVTGDMLALSYAATCIGQSGTNGFTKCWGYNLNGKLGLGNNNVYKGIPTLDTVPFLPNLGMQVQQLRGGMWNMCASGIDAGTDQSQVGRRVKCWGANTKGILGLGDTNDRGDNQNEVGPNLPFIDLGLNRAVGITSLVMGEEHACAVVQATGQIKCWGGNTYGQLGQGNTVSLGDNPDEMGDQLPYVPLGSEASETTDRCPGMDDNNSCTVDTCDTVRAMVTHTALSDNTTCDDGNGCTVSDKCAGGKCVGTVDPGCSACAGSNCSDSCPCNAGQGTCSANSHCKAGFTCGSANGASFGQPATANVCWPESCDSDPFQGQCRRFPRSCVANADCAAGEVCGANNSTQFDSQYAHVCWPAACETAPVVTGCGTLQSLCGKCPCVPTCPTSASSCDHEGSYVSDGCGGICSGFCGNGGLGCRQDSDCQLGSVCEIGKGHLFGGTASQSVCWPQSCRTTPAETRDCGTPTSACGSVCEVCQAECGTRQCGADPKCGKSCGVCGSGQFCTVSGQCEALSTDPLFLAAPKNVVAPSEAGALAGNFTVTPSGQAHYSIPLAVPPGVNGLTPHLSLEYQSDAGPGPYGLGWKLGGTSVIRRCPRNYAQSLDEHHAQPIQYNDQDQFCLDGVALVTTGVSDGVTSYSTELESFATIKSYPTVGYDENVGPDRFVIEQPDGQITTYGGEASWWAYGNVETLTGGIGAKTTWALSRIEDRYGNVIDFGYRGLKSCDHAGEHQLPPGHPDATGAAWILCGSEPVLNSVSYGYNKSTGVRHNRSIEFKYSYLDEVGRSPMIRYGWASGEPLGMNLACDSIKMSFEGVEVRNYKMEYHAYFSPLPDSGRWLELSTVSECYGDKCKAPTKFTHSAPSLLNWGTDRVNAGTPKSADGKRLSLRTIEARLDANGDGLEDFLLNPNRDQRNSLACRNDWVMAFATGNQNTPYNFVPFRMSNSTCATIVALDQDSDGKWEMVGPQSIVTHLNGNQFSEQPRPSGVQSIQYDNDGDGRPTGVVENLRPRYMNPTLLDTNSDGVLDSIWSKENELGVGPSYWGEKSLLGIHLETHTLDQIEADAYARFMKTNSRDCAVPPKCDGPCFYDPFPTPESEYCDDIFHFNPSAFAGGIQVLDFNGDGQSDLIEWHPGMGKKLIGSEPTTFDEATLNFQYSMYPPPYQELSWEDVATTTQSLSFPVPFDKVAKFDIRAYVNTGGNAFVGSTAPVSVAVWPQGEDTKLTSRDFKNSFHYDTDHDGREELIVVLPYGSVISIPIRPDLSPGEAGTFVRSIGRVNVLGDYDKFVVTDVDGNGQPDVLYGDETWQVLFQNGQAAADRLTQIEDGVGRIDTIEYKAGKEAPYTPGQFVQASARVVQIVPPVVTSHLVQERTGDLHQLPPTMLTETFSYENAQTGLYGRGPLGFYRTTRTVEAGGAFQLYEVNEYDNYSYFDVLDYGTLVYHAYPFAGRLRLRDRTYPTVSAGIGRPTDTLEVTEHEEWNYEIGISFRAIPFVYLRNDSYEWRESINDGEPLARWGRVHDYQVNPYGAAKATLENVHWSGHYQTTFTTHEYEYSGNDLTAAWPRRLPTKTTTTNSINDQSVTRNVQRGYDGMGGLQFEQDGSGQASLSKRTAFTRNARG